VTDEVIKHYGTPRHSGRYPFGSGQDPNQRGGDFMSRVDELKSKGHTDSQIAEKLGVTTTALRAKRAIAKSEKRKEQESVATRLRDKGMGASAIGKQMGLNESSVRALLNPSAKARNDVLENTASALRNRVKEAKYIDVGSGQELHLGISKEKMNTALSILEEEGYVVHKFSAQQQGTGKMTTNKVLCPPGTPYPEILKNQAQIQGVHAYSEDKGHTFKVIEDPQSVSSHRVGVRYGSEGGAGKDGLIELRKGVADVSLMGKRYAQVRIAVDDTHYLKGMAVYSDKLPLGVDVMFNTNKENTGNKLDAMKPLQNVPGHKKYDPDNPFGAVVRQRHYQDEKGKDHLSAINIVNEEGDWNEWSRTLSSQFLSKQKPELAQRQLDLAFIKKKTAFDEINRLTNPAVKKRLLESFGDDCDSAAVHLKAAAMPRQRAQVIIPIPGLKDNEIYAPNFRPGELVVLVRHPHGGTFEIPELVVNNSHPEAKRVLGQARDAVGINANVAARLSGADFDGDTVLVIPNNNRAATSSMPLRDLKDFDPIRAYPGYPGMKVLDGKSKQRKMGEVSNLITDMTIKGANTTELARAVKHSMVVIDAEKHKLNHKLSYQQNGIAGLKAKYQDGGASTLISRAKADVRPLDRKGRPSKEGGPVDRVTGEKKYVLTNESYVDKHGNTVMKRIKSTQMAETTDANTLVSRNGGTPMEKIYASHANKLKALANQTRLEHLATPNMVASPSAKKMYDSEARALNDKLQIALMNAPFERRAQRLAAEIVAAKRAANKNMEADELKKIRGLALLHARNKVGAKKERIDITPREWEAIQAGAISHTKLTEILKHADLEQVKQYATPKTQPAVSASTLSRAKAMAANGHTQSEISDALGIPIGTLDAALYR